MSGMTGVGRALPPAVRDSKPREPLLAQFASFVELLIWLLVLRSFFLPLFIIPTGSMASTLMGAHADYTCTNCGFEFPVGVMPQGGLPQNVLCPNCRYVEDLRRSKARLVGKAGDRIIVHGWTTDVGGALGPRRWDAVVFKNPNEPEVNFIKRLLGLPGETIAFVDGDLWTAPAGKSDLRVARKTPEAQEALWIPYFDQDFLPRRVGEGYAPRWEPEDGTTHWNGLKTRRFEFGSADGEATIAFRTRRATDPPEILDVLGYNGLLRNYHVVSDVRVGADVEFVDEAGFVELSLSKGPRRFLGTLHVDGRVELSASTADGAAAEWGSTRVSLSNRRPVRLALGHADYRVSVQIDGVEVLASSDEQYSLSIDEARAIAAQPSSAAPAIRAGRGRVHLTHIRIDRDIYYTPSDMGSTAARGANAPLKLPDDAYFVCGDNSPLSHDSRFWTEASLGGHLREKLKSGDYLVGTVPADQMIGRAFFVYWPGFLPLTSQGPALLPDLGRVRWIH